jgi:hypothetical protein
MPIFINLNIDYYDINNIIYYPIAIFPCDGSKIINYRGVSIYRIDS